jgi:hypothetical protein
MKQAFIGIDVGTSSAIAEARLVNNTHDDGR